jgi:hypothetical protein
VFKKLVEGSINIFVSSNNSIKKTDEQIENQNHNRRTSMRQEMTIAEKEEHAQEIQSDTLPKIRKPLI